MNLSVPTAIDRCRRLGCRLARRCPAIAIVRRGVVRMVVRNIRRAAIGRRRTLVRATMRSTIRARTTLRRPARSARTLVMWPARPARSSIGTGTAIRTGTWTTCSTISTGTRPASGSTRTITRAARGAATSLVVATSRGTLLRLRIGARLLLRSGLTGPRLLLRGWLGRSCSTASTTSATACRFATWCRHRHDRGHPNRRRNDDRSLQCSHTFLQKNQTAPPATQLEENSHAENVANVQHPDSSPETALFRRSPIGFFAKGLDPPMQNRGKHTPPMNLGVPYHPQPEPLVKFRPCRGIRPRSHDVHRPPRQYHNHRQRNHRLHHHQHLRPPAEYRRIGRR